MSADATADPPRPTSGGRIPVLDGWRGLAILVVVFHNAGAISYSLSGERGLATALLDTALAPGWVGVQLFFVLSGFLITGILLDTAGRPGYFRSFYLRRTFRIFPVYYVLLVFAFLVVPLAAPGAGWIEGPRADQLWYWLYLSNWRPLLEHPPGAMSHLWSLAVEEQFYLVWPLVVLLAGRRFPWVAVFVLVASPASRVAMLAAGWELDSLYYFTNARADALAVGALLAVAARSERRWAPSLRAAPAVLAATSVGLIAIVLTTRGFVQQDALVLVVGQTLIAVWFAVLMQLSLEPRSGWQRRMARELERPWLRAFGKYSYAIYVFHVPLSQPLVPSVVERIGVVSTPAHVGLTFAYIALILAASTALAAVSWRVLEAPLNRVKDRVSPRPAAA